MTLNRATITMNLPPFIRFLAVGFLNTVFGYMLFALLTWMGLSYPWAIGLSTIVGVLFNFQTTGRLVFGTTNKQRLIRFIGAYALIYVLNVGGVALLLGWGFNVYWAGALLLLPMAGISYFTLRVFVFQTT